MCCIICRINAYKSFSANYRQKMRWGVLVFLYHRNTAFIKSPQPVRFWTQYELRSGSFGLSILSINIQCNVYTYVNKIRLTLETGTAGQPRNFIKMPRCQINLSIKNSSNISILVHLHSSPSQKAFSNDLQWHYNVRNLDLSFKFQYSFDKLFIIVAGNLVSGIFMSSASSLFCSKFQFGSPKSIFDVRTRRDN